MNIVQTIKDFFGIEPDSVPSFVTLPSSKIQWQPLGQSNGADRGIFLGGMRFPTSLDGHVLVIGTTRSGKTSTLRLLIQDAFPDVLDPSRDTRALVYDPKREMHGILAGLGLADLIVTLDPFDARSYALDWPASINDHRGAKDLAATLVPRNQSNDGTPFFESALRALIESVVIGLIDRHEKTSRRWSLRTVLNVLEDDKLIRSVAGRHHKGKKDIESFLDGRKDTALDLRGVTRNYLNEYGIIANLWHHAELEGNLFSVDEWLATNRILILPAPPVSEDDDPHDAVSQLNRILFGEIANRLLQLPEARLANSRQRTWIVLDEFRFAGKLPGLLSLFTTGASKGTRIVVGVHNLSGLQDSLGKERASEVFDLCSIKAFFRAGNAETAKVMAEQFGNVREVLQQRSDGPGWGTTVTYSEVDRPVLLDEAFLNLPLPKYDPATGEVIDLAGYYRIAGVPGQPNAFYSELPMKRLYGPGGAIRPVALGHEFRERPKCQQEPIPFTSEEFHELLGEPMRKRNDKSATWLRKLQAGATKGLFRQRDDG